MNPTPAGQNVILIGYTSSGVELGTLTEGTAARVPGLAERFNGICNSVADFFISAEGKANNSLHQLGDWVKSIAIRQKEPETVLLQKSPEDGAIQEKRCLLAAQETLKAVQAHLPDHLNHLKEALDNKKTLTADSLMALSSGNLRKVITAVSGIGTKLGGSAAQPISKKATELLSEVTDFLYKPPARLTDMTVSDMGTISSANDALRNLETDNFETQFRNKAGKLLTDIEQYILPELMKLRPENITIPSKEPVSG